jgi:hypothetical protein
MVFRALDTNECWCGTRRSQTIAVVLDCVGDTEIQRRTQEPSRLERTILFPVDVSTRHSAQEDGEGTAGKTNARSSLPPPPSTIHCTALAQSFHSTRIRGGKSARQFDRTLRQYENQDV